MHLLLPPTSGFQTVGQVRARVLPAEILPLLRELNPAKRGSQREHKFSIISPSWWPPPSLFSSSGTSWFLLPCSHLPSELVCWRLLELRRIKIKSVERVLQSAFFFSSFNVLFVTHNFKKSINIKACCDCRGRWCCSCGKWCADRLYGFILPIF